jgi:dTDP-4-amino-4,6-dideoxygalactose transaminase
MNYNPYASTQQFEEVIADFCGSKYAVAVESCTSALFLSLMWTRHENGEIVKMMQDRYITLPAKTYPGVACSVIHAGFKVKFTHNEWSGEYPLFPLNIWDAALRFRRGMYHGGLQCISFHSKKILNIGRGGAILTDDENAVKWLRKARFDGRSPVPLLEDDFTMLGWNCYLTPEQGARGMQLFQSLISRWPDGPEDLDVSEQGYPNLDLYPIYKQ